MNRRISKEVAAHHAANEAARNTRNRVGAFKFLRRLKRLPRGRMSYAVLVQLGLETGG